MYAYMCMCQKSVCSCAIPCSISKQIQMVVVVGLPLQCRGLYCFSEREDEPLRQRGYVNETVKHQMNMQLHTHTWLLHLCLWGGHKAAKYFPRPRAESALISQICQKQQRNIRKVMIHISSSVLVNICHAKLLSTTAFDNHINFLTSFYFKST